MLSRREAVIAGLGSGPWMLAFAAGPADALERIEAVARVIGTRLGQTVVATPCDDPLEIMQASPHALVIGWLAYDSVLDAVERAIARPVAMVQYQGDPFYRAMIVSRAGEREAWPPHARGKTLLVGARRALAGWIAPVADLRGAGIDVEAHFNVVEAANLRDGVLSVMRGDGHYAVTYDRALRATLNAGDIAPDDVNVVWASRPLPYDALVAPSRLDKGAVQRLRSSLLSIGGTAATGKMPINYTGFSYASTEDYEALRAMITAAA